MKCPKCNGSMVKGGTIKDKQRYKCKECGYNYYSVETKSTTKPKSLKIQRLALHLYLEGLDSHSIGKILGVSNVSMLKWIKEFGQKIQELNTENKENKQIEIVEIDKMHSYVASKKTTVGCRMLLIDMEKDSLISLLAAKGTKQQKNFGKRKKNTN